MKNAIASVLLLALSQLGSAVATDHNEPQEYVRRRYSHDLNDTSRGSKSRLTVMDDEARHQRGDAASTYGSIDAASTLDSRALQGIPTQSEAAALAWINQHPAVATFSEARREQLLGMTTLYFATLGDMWTTSTNWLAYTVPECVWYNNAGTPEEVCDAEGFLTRLDLEDNNLAGSLPNDFFNLKNLTSLDLEDNMLEGRLSANVRNFRQMRKLQLNKNMFSGRLPNELAALAVLEELDLSENQFEGSLNPLYARLRVLKILNLYYAGGNTGLTGTIPVEFYTMPMLMDLNLEYNAFTGTLPTEIGLSPSLEFLSESSLPACLLISQIILHLFGVWLAYVCVYVCLRP